MLICVFGRRGSGKTTIIRGMIPNLKKPIIIVDILDNYAPDPEKNPTNTPWVGCDSHIQALQSLLEYVRDPKKHSGIIVVRCTDINICVDYMCSALWKIGGGTLVLDEADAFSSAEAPCFDEAIRYGRNRDISIITGCRRPAEISRNVTAGCDVAYCLVTHEPRDIEYYRDFLGDDLAFKLPELPPHHGIYKDFLHQRSGIFKADITGKISIVKNQKSVQNTIIEQEPEKPGPDSKNLKAEPIGERIET